VIVLWLLVLLTAIAGSHAYNTHVETRLARNRVEQVAVRQAAAAGVERAVLELLNPVPGKRWTFDGRSHALAIGEAEVTVSLRDLAGLVDLNAATPELLDALLTAAEKQSGGALTIDEATRKAVVDAIGDWRDRDDLRRLNGAEAAEYLAADRGYGPTNGPFASVHELRYVLGMTPELYETLAPLLTVHSKMPGINPDYAPEALLTGLPGADLVARGARGAAQDTGVEAPEELPTDGLDPAPAREPAASAGSSGRPAGGSSGRSPDRASAGTSSGTAAESPAAPAAEPVASGGETPGGGDEYGEPPVDSEDGTGPYSPSSPFQWFAVQDSDGAWVSTVTGGSQTAAPGDGAAGPAASGGDAAPGPGAGTAAPGGGRGPATGGVRPPSPRPSATPPSQPGPAGATDSPAGQGGGLEPDPGAEGGSTAGTGGGRRGQAQFFNSRTSDVYEVLSLATLPSGTRAQVTAVVARSRVGERPYVILEWRER
jgi:general secretion pathway protein K